MSRRRAPKSVRASSGPLSPARLTRTSDSGARAAIVAAALGAVDLVAAARAVLEVPQLTVEVELEAEQVAVAVRPDFAADPAALGERIARGGGAVEVESQHFAEVGAEVLRRFPLHPLAARQEQVLAVGREG